MVTKDVKSYLANNYEAHLETISSLSMSDEGKILVEDERKLYNFDKITKQLYRKSTPESTDAIYSTDKKVIFVEFKSGFSKKVSKDNYRKELMRCAEDDQKECVSYGELFLKNQKNEDKIIRHSIHMKAVESYMTFMKEIEPKSEIDGRKKGLLFCVVVDDYIENAEDILNDLAKKSSSTNIISSLRQSLSRFYRNSKKDYYYDEILVLTPHEFKNFIGKNVS